MYAFWCHVFHSRVFSHIVLFARNRGHGCAEFDNEHAGQNLVLFQTENTECNRACCQQYVIYKIITQKWYIMQLYITVQNYAH